MLACTLVVAIVAATSEPACLATSENFLRSKFSGTSRMQKLGSPAQPPDGDAECPVCLEPFTKRRRGDRTVHDGSAQGVVAVFDVFRCKHVLCAACDAQMRSRGLGPCPLCREERVRPLENDTRNSERAASDGPAFGGGQLVAVGSGGVLLLTNAGGEARVFFPTARPRRAPRRAAPQAPGEAAPSSSAGAGGAPVQLHATARLLVDALRDPQLLSFQEFLEASLQEPVGPALPDPPPLDPPLPPPSRAESRWPSVLRVRPRRW